MTAHLGPDTAGPGLHAGGAGSGGDTGAPGTDAGPAWRQVLNGAQPAATVRHLLARLALLEERLARTVGGEPNLLADPGRGLEVMAEEAARLSGSESASDVPGGDIDAARASVEAWADRVERAGERLRLREMERAFGLDTLDTEILLVALAPDVVSRFSSWYSLLGGEAAAGSVTVRLALRLCSSSTASAFGRARFLTAAPLVAPGLLQVRDTDRPLSGRSLIVPDRVVSHLLGDDTIDDELEGRARLVHAPSHPVPVAYRNLARRLAGAVRDGARSVYIWARDIGSATDFAVAAMATSGSPVLVLESPTVQDAAEADRTPVVAAVREALLRGCPLLVAPGIMPSPALDCVGRRPAAVPLVLTGTTPWGRDRGRAPDLVLEAPVTTDEDRVSMWRYALARTSADRTAFASGEPAQGASSPGGRMEPQDSGALAQSMSSYRLGPAQILTSARAAVARSRFEEVPLALTHLRDAARIHNATGLGRLARRIIPRAGWGDLVLGPLPASQLRDLADRARHRGRVLGNWQMRPGGNRGTGVAGLFTGESGTGKTLAAEVLAGDLGLDLYVVDLATVVDKYIGETEKHLEQIFTEAAEVNGVLLFDEADAIFARRCETQDAHDRYANLETAYLLQRLETFDGLALLTTNLYGNIDPAFTRRLDLVVHFPPPDATDRRTLWDLCLGTALPRSADLDLDLIARNFELAGGSIRSCALTAAYRAAATGQPVDTSGLASAIRAEYRKLGRLARTELFEALTTSDTRARDEEGRPP
ncbi:ATP-binding protein [Streptomyces lavendulae]|uniref:AAA family ATPase n=1 Tax=Streptomyces lavendulae TaxID=1914 RepID=UPI0033CE219C